MGFLLPLLTFLCFPEPESGWNLNVVLVTVSVIAAIIIILIGFGIRELRCGNTRDGVRKAAQICLAVFWGSCTVGVDPTLCFLSFFKPHEFPAQPHRSYSSLMDPHHSPTDLIPFPQIPPFP